MTISRDEVAEFLGMKESTVKGNLGLREMTLPALARFLTQRILRQSRVLTHEEFSWAYLDNDPVRMARWEARYPRFNAWSCPLCDDGLPQDALLVRGLCTQHGTGYPALRLGDPHVQVQLADGYRPYHRLIFDPPGRHVHHIDFNPWNNRRENLQALTAAEHGRIHMKVGGLGLQGSMHALVAAMAAESAKNRALKSTKP